MSFREDIAALVEANSYGALASGDGWPRVPLGEVARVINGFAFQSKYFSPDKGTPLVRIRDVVEGSSNTRYCGPVPDGYAVEDGDLLVGMDGDFNSAYWQGGPALLNQRVCKIAPDETRLRRKFLGYALPAYLKLINDHTSSVTVKHLSSRTLQSLPIPLPLVETQDAIVARIDQLFAEIDDGECALAAANRGLNVYSRAVLNAGLSGRLTHASRHVKQEAMPVSDSATLPNTWRWVPLGEICDFITKGTTPPKGKWGEPRERVVPFIRVTNLTDNGSLDFSDRVFVSDETHRNFLKRSITYPGDVLMNIVGPPLGQVSIVPDTFSEWNINQAVARFRPKPSISSEFLALCLRSDIVQQWLMARAKATSGQINLTLELCREALIPLPSREEQARIVTLIRTVMSEFTRPFDMPIESMRRSILAAAFRGDLVA